MVELRRRVWKNSRVPMEEGESAEEGELVWALPSGKPSLWRRARDKAVAYWLLLPLSLAAAGLLAVDLAGVGSSFWEANPLVVNFLSEVVVAAIFIYGIDRVLRARSARLWRPLGVRIAKELDAVADLHDLLEGETLAYCERAYGEYDVPADRDYPGSILLEALLDPLTWAEPEEDFPAFLPHVVDRQEVLEARFNRWASVLIAEPNLAAIAARASELIEANHYLVMALKELQPGARASLPVDLAVWSVQHFGAIVLANLRQSELISFELKKEVTRYVTGQPLVLGPAAASVGR